MILITGINGFIGSQIARLLARRGERVRGLIRASSNLSNLSDLKKDIELVVGDIRDANKLKEIFKGVDVCYHTAALVKAGEFDKKEYFSTNLNGTMNVCAAALETGVKKFIYTSTCEALRPATGQLITEQNKSFFADMLGDYGRSKFLAEEHVMAMAVQKLPAVIVNPTGVVGPGDVNITPPSFLICQYCNGRIPFYFETGFNIVDVRDVADGHILACEKGKVGQRYLLGGSNVMLSELFDLLNKVLGRRPFCKSLPYGMISFGARFMGDKFVSIEKVRASKMPFFFDSTKACVELGWKTQYELKATLKEAWEFYRSA